MAKQEPHIPWVELTRLRQDRGWTSKDLAAAAGISERHAQYLETGHRLGRPRLLAKVARALGMTVTELLATRDDADDEPSGRAA